MSKNERVHDLVVKHVDLSRERGGKIVITIFCNDDYTSAVLFDDIADHMRAGRPITFCPVKR